MKKIFLLATMAVATVMGANAKTVTTPATNVDSPAVFQSFKALMDGNTLESYEILSEAVAENPDDAFLHLLMAMQYGIIDSDEALNYLDKAIALYDKEGNKKMLAFCYSEKGDYLRSWDRNDEALQNHSKAIRIEKDNSQLYMARALDYQAMGDYDSMISDVKKANKLDPEDTATILYLANAYEGKGEYGKAIDTYTKFCELDSLSDISGAVASRGNCYIALGDYENAADDFIKLLELAQEGYGDGYILFNISEMAENSFDLMDSKLALANVADPGNPVWEYHRGALRAYAGRNIESINYLIDLNKELQNANVSNAISTLAYSLDDYETALKYIDEAIALDSPDNYEYVVQRTDILDMLGRYDDAAAYYTSQLEENPYLAFIYLGDRGDMYLKAGEYEKAIADFSAAMEDVDTEYVRIRRGAAYKYLGDEKKAKEDFDYVINSEDSDFYKALAYAYMGEKDNALDEIARLLDEEIELEDNLMGARIYALIGENEKALECLKAYLDQGQGHEIVYIESCPDLKPLRNMPEFQALIAERKQKIQEIHNQIKK